MQVIWLNTRTNTLWTGLTLVLKCNPTDWAASISGVVHALNVFFGLDWTFSEGKHKQAERKERNSEIRQKELLQ